MIIAPRPEWLYTLPLVPASWTWGATVAVIALNVMLVVYSADSAAAERGRVLRWVCIPGATAAVLTAVLVIDMSHRPPFLLGAVLLISAGLWVVQGRLLRAGRMCEHRRMIAAVQARPR